MILCSIVSQVIFQLFIFFYEVVSGIKKMQSIQKRLLLAPLHMSMLEQAANKVPKGRGETKIKYLVSIVKMVAPDDKRKTSRCAGS